MLGNNMSGQPPYMGFDVVQDPSVGEYILKRKPRSKKRRIIKKWFNKYKEFKPLCIVDKARRIVYAHPTIACQIPRQ